MLCSEDFEQEELMASVKQDRALDSTLGAIVAHPLRARCLTILTERTASPKEIANQIDEEVGNVAYHVKRLGQMGAVELVDTAQRRGATEHFWRAIKRPHVSDAEYTDLSTEERLRFDRFILQLSVADAATAIESGSFAARPDHHVARFPARVDDQGFKELNDIYNEALDKALEVQAASAERMQKDPEAVAIPARVVSMVFEMERPGA
jgi:DNA-binding transcriptional ArsR family regulator